MTAPGAPDYRFLVAHPAHMIALGFGTGLVPVAPGTAGTLFGVLLGAYLARYTSDLGYLAVVALTIVVGAWAAERTGRDLGVADHGGIVIDEIAAIMLVLFFTGFEGLRPAFAFLLFRLFDVVKPPPIRTLDARWKNGVGVMADDLVAAGFALLVFALGVRLLAWF